MAMSAILGEQYPSKVGAVFESGDDARKAAEELVRQTGLSKEQVRVVQPDDPALGRKLEPESRGIARTLVRSHLSLGITGLVLGLLIALVLVMSGIGTFAANPYYTVGVLGVFGAIAGLLLGGLVSLRPDHDRLIAWVKAAAGRGKWFVLVHARDHDEERRAMQRLEGMSDKVIGTF